LRWTNTAGVSWALIPDFPNGMLRFGPGNPYIKAPDRAQSFQLVVRRDANGDYIPELAGLTFEGEFYPNLGHQ
jgi:hypothetical protein